MGMNANQSPIDRSHIGDWKKTFSACAERLSQLANFVVPFSGVILPIVMWATEKENSAKVDAHGRIVFNWLISSTIYFICSLVLVLLGIGILMLIALGIASVIFTILGGIKANEGKIWKYPMSIRFFSTSTP